MPLFALQTVRLNSEKDSEEAGERKPRLLSIYQTYSGVIYQELQCKIPALQTQTFYSVSYFDTGFDHEITDFP